MFDTAVYPTTYTRYDTEKLLRVYDTGPQRIKQIMEGLSEKELKTHTREGKWSIFQIIIHLADAEIMGAARVRQTFTQSGREFAFYNQNVWADTMDYENMDMAAFYNAIKLFEMLRLTTSLIFHQATPEDWQKTGIHAELGELTLRQLLELYADHSERHVSQIMEIRKALEKSINIPMLLEERLY